jgi:hypothetical protein
MHDRFEITHVTLQVVTLKTKVGSDYYDSINELFRVCQSDEEKSLLLSLLKKRKNDIRTTLEHFSEDKEMTSYFNMSKNDSLGWVFYQETYDKYETLIFFIRRMQYDHRTNVYELHNFSTKN